MLDQITLGQYYPSGSVVHRLDPRMKIVLLLLYIGAVFLSQSLWGFLPVALFVAAAIRLARIPMRLMLKSLKPLRFIILFTFVLNIFFLGGDTVLLDLRFARVTLEGLRTAVLYALRLVFLVFGSSLLTFTTAPVPLTDGLERLLSPLRAVKFPAHEMAMMMTIALRFIPTLLEEANKIMKAQSARGADFETGNLLRRARAMIPLLVPLFVSSFRRAGDLAMAMESRCYRGGEGRTRLHVLRLRRDDYAALGYMLLLIGAVVAVNLLVK